MKKYLQKQWCCVYSILQIKIRKRRIKPYLPRGNELHFKKFRSHQCFKLQYDSYNTITFCDLKITCYSTRMCLADFNASAQTVKRRQESHYQREYSELKDLRITGHSTWLLDR